ncbi:hypothetical protein [Francisella hispaniensis]|uniref:Cadherin-like beta sandwich domain-containing protein n=1 Tax=Francisella hispaniensis FSC454 TaxID=1088883 RepID=A0AAC9J6G6_9GAMM|nr:hypothetical protein [Francisella hispaniensis]APD51110.1 hypothetical protein FSC454_08495 [Francisella hispaniensis FSC454]KYW86724.1 hypothetical protein AUF42_00570 [Francisella hispaniensis FSC454]
MKTKILLASILGCSSILTGYAKENVNNNSHIVAGTNYAGQFKATVGTDKITGERIVTYTLPSGLLSEPEKYASYEITFGNSHNGMKSEKSEEIPINENTLTYVYRVSDEVAEGTVWEGYISTYDKQHGSLSSVFSLNPVTIPAIDEKVLISEPQEDGTVFTITYDDPSVTLNPSLSNTKQGDVVLDDGMEVIDDGSTNPDQIKVKINKKAIHTIKVNVSDKKVKQYKLQVGPQQYPQNIKDNDIIKINAVAAPLGNLYAYIYFSRADTEGINSINIRSQDTTVRGYKSGRWFPIYSSTTPIDRNGRMASDYQISFKTTESWEEYMINTSFSQSTKYYTQVGKLETIVRDFSNYTGKYEYRVINWDDPTPI